MKNFSIKGLFGGIFFTGGFVATVLIIQRNLNSWFFVLAFLAFWYGLYYTIEDMIDRAKKEMIEKIEELKR